MRAYRLFPGPPASLEYLLRLGGHEVLALDLRPLGSEDTCNLRDSLLLHRNIGLFPADLGFYRTVVPNGFHVILFVDSTTATKPIEEH